MMGQPLSSKIVPTFGSFTPSVRRLQLIGNVDLSRLHRVTGWRCKALKINIEVSGVLAVRGNAVGFRNARNGHFQLTGDKLQ